MHTVGARLAHDGGGSEPGALEQDVRGFVRDAAFQAAHHAGLLHDAGRLIIFKNMPYGSVQALLTARSEMLPLVEAERQVLGYDHTQVGDLLFQEWKMPDFLRDIIANHHSPANATNPKNAALVQLADNLANAMTIPSGSTFVLPGMLEDDWKQLGLQDKHLQTICHEHDQCIDQVLEAFL